MYMISNVVSIIGPVKCVGIVTVVCLRLAA